MPLPSADQVVGLVSELGLPAAGGTLSAAASSSMTAIIRPKPQGCV